MSFNKAMKDKKQLENEKNVLHQGFEGQKVAKNVKMSFIKAMKDKKQLRNDKNVLYQMKDKKQPEKRELKKCLNTNSFCKSGIGLIF